VPKSAIFSAVDLLQPLDLPPQPGHRAGVKHLKLELAHVVQDGAGAQFHQHRQRRDFPQHHLGPALEGQLNWPSRFSR
jgi:hypothetical protein